MTGIHPRPPRIAAAAFAVSVSSRSVSIPLPASADVTCADVFEGSDVLPRAEERRRVSLVSSTDL